MKAIDIGDSAIGLGEPCFIVAEIGINHNGDMDLAKKTIDAAAENGADAVKVQNYRTEDFIGDRDLTFEYESQGETVEETQWEMFKRCELSQDDLKMLADYCDKQDIAFFSTPTGPEGVEELVDLGVPLLKNGSDYLVHLPLIERMAETGIPTILSTGMATAAEIDEAVRAYREADGEDLILLHCVSTYPAPLDEINLRQIETLRDAFGVPVGFSDHTDGIAAPVTATALGASVIEKHFTLDRNLPGPDHRFSMDPDQLSDLVGTVRGAEASLGEPQIRPSETEEQSREEFRLSCVASRALEAGHELAREDIRFQRPGTGLAPKHVDLLVDRELISDVEKGDVLHPGMTR